MPYILKGSLGIRCVGLLVRWLAFYIFYTIYLRLKYIRFSCRCTMELGTPLYIIILLFSILFHLKPTEAFKARKSFPIDEKTLDELITPIILGAVLGEVRSRTKSHQGHDDGDNMPSPQEQRPFFVPVGWPPLPRHPVHPPLKQHPFLPPMIPVMHPLPIPFQVHPYAHSYPHPHPHVHPHAHPHMHPHPHVHPHSRAHPHLHHQTIVMSHELIPVFHQQVLDHIIQQLQHPGKIILIYFLITVVSLYVCCLISNKSNEWRYFYLELFRAC